MQQNLLISLSVLLAHFAGHVSAENAELLAVEQQRHSLGRQHATYGELGRHLALEFPEKLTVTEGRNGSVEFAYRGELNTTLVLSFDFNRTILRVEPARLVLSPTNATAVLTVTGLALSSRTFIDLANCTTPIGPCPFNTTDVFVQVEVVKSPVITIFVLITGWIYFLAWSISFYPQIILNWQRKSVIGLNFDFLFLNVIGFTCYTIYNVLLYFDDNVQDLYVARHGNRSLIPVLLNDVVFASHALLACIITGIQCFLYERGNQRISYTCRAWATLLLGFSFLSLVFSLIHWHNWLDFINYLSYVKMAVTMSKYFPQAILNFRRKSTVGWSIGNVLLDFIGGSMDICQMVLQAVNTDDWSAFTGNPVKFGLGLVSIVFDVLFIFQHYVLYPHKVYTVCQPETAGESLALLQELNTYDHVSSDEAPSAPTRPVHLHSQQQDDEAEPVVFP